MATRQELEAALRKADQAGNTEDAKRLAAAIRAMPATPNIDATRAEFDALPTWQKPFKAADDVVRMMANGLTLGWADNLAGAMPGGEGTEAEKMKSMEAQQRGGSASTAAQILGTLLPASSLSQGAGAITGLTGRGIGESALREGLAGSAMGLTSTLSDTSDLGELAGGATTGAASGMLGGALGSMGGSFLNWAGKKLGFSPGSMVDDVIPPKSVDELRTATDAAYDRVDQLGTRYDPADFQRMVGEMDAALQDARINPRLHPNATAMMDDIRNMPASSPPSPRNMDELRQVINRDVTGTRGEGHMAGIMARNVDDFIANGKTTTGVTSESAAGASDALRTARDLNRRMRTLQDVDQALFKGENAAGSRGDVAALRTMLNNPARTRGMSTPEKEALKRVVRGDTWENVLRSGVGGIPISPLGAGIVTGSITQNPVMGVLAGGATALGKPLAEKAARRYTDANIARLLDAIGGGQTIPSAARKIMPPLGTATDITLTENERRRLRKKD